jgi:type IV pilus assembly protein PilW
MAGFLGCSGAVNVIPLNDTLTLTPASFAPQLGVQGWEATGSAPADALTLDFAAAPVSVLGGTWTSSGAVTLDAFQAVPETDVIRIWRADEAGARVTALAGDTATLTANPRFQDGDMVILSDCQNIDVIRACDAVTGADTVLDMDGCAPGEPRSTLPLTLGTGVGAQANRLVGTVFYVGKRADAAANPPALFRRQLLNNGQIGPAEELVEGVESLQILYGVDITGNRQLDQYVTADAVADWQDVMAVRISLLLVSIEDNLVDAGQQILFNERPDQAPADRRLRQVMTTTIALRNRTL